jgi:hypothetical protein
MSSHICQLEHVPMTQGRSTLERREVLTLNPWKSNIKVLEEMGVTT